VPLGAKGLSRKGDGECRFPGFLEGDETAGELEESEVVAVFLRPADEDATVAVEPGVGRFYDPASGVPARDVELVGDLVAAGADVRRELIRNDELVALAVVVGLVKAEALWRLGCRLGPLDRDRVERRLQELVVVAVGALVCQPDRDAAALAENRTFRPFFALSVGFGPVFGPPSGAFVIALTNTCADFRARPLSVTVIPNHEDRSKVLVVLWG
jgi:hypothetical protein